MFARRRQSLQWSSSLTHLTCACRSREEVSVHSNHMPLGMCTSQQSNACEHFLVICSLGAKIIKREISLSKKWVGRAKAGLFFVHIDVHVEGIDWECNNSRWMKELGFGYSEVKAVGFQYSNRLHRRKKKVRSQEETNPRVDGRRGFEEGIRTVHVEVAHVLRRGKVTRWQVLQQKAVALSDVADTWMLIVGLFGENPTAVSG